MRYIGVLCVLIIVSLILSLTQESFLTLSNIINMLDSNAVLLIISIGITFNILTGGLDLSVGSTAAFASLILSELLRIGSPPWLAILFALISGLALGLAVNGLLIGKVRVSFFVVTLGTMALYRGLVMVYTQARTIYLFQWPVISYMGTRSILGIRIPILISILLVGLAYFVLEYTTYGKAVFAVGGNEEAASLGGISTSWIVVSVYGISGLTAALGGIVYTARFVMMAPTAVTGIELDVAAAVLLGGTSFSGGVGGIVGTFIGVLFIGVLRNGLSLMGVSSFLQGIFVGIVLIVAVTLDAVRGRKSR